MEEIFSYINTMLPSPYSDLAAVAAIFIVLLIVAFILSFLFEEKKPKEPARPEPEAPALQKKNPRPRRFRRLT